MNNRTESSMNAVPADVVDYLASARSLEGESDILDVAPGLTYPQAYRAQFESKVRQAGANGPIIGYQASLTSEGAKRFGPPDMPKPYMGTLQLRNWHHASVPFPKAAVPYGVECEIGMRMARRLSGTALTAVDARQAVASVHAAFEIVPLYPHLAKRSGQHMVAIHNFGSSIVFSQHRGSAELDLVQEPVELFVDGKRVASGVAGNSGGDPFVVLAEIANTIGAHGLALEPGMVVMTGSILPPHPLPAGTRRIEGRFGRLGTLGAEFDA